MVMVCEFFLSLSLMVECFIFQAVFLLLLTQYIESKMQYTLVMSFPLRYESMQLLVSADYYQCNYYLNHQLQLTSDETRVINALQSVIARGLAVRGTLNQSMHSPGTTTLCTLLLHVTINSTTKHDNTAHVA